MGVILLVFIAFVTVILVYLGLIGKIGSTVEQDRIYLNQVGFLFHDCKRAVNWIKSTMDFDKHDKIYTRYLGQLNNINSSLDYIKDKLKSTYHYADQYSQSSKTDEQKQAVFHAVADIYSFTLSTLQSITYIDKSMVRENTDLMNSIDSLTTELAEFYKDSYSKLIGNDLLKLSLDIQALRDINIRNSIEAELINEMATGKDNNIDRLEKKYKDGELC